LKVPTDFTKTTTSIPTTILNTESSSKTFLENPKESITRTSLETNDLYANLFDPNDE